MKKFALEGQKWTLIKNEYSQELKHRTNVDIKVCMYFARRFLVCPFFIDSILTLILNIGSSCFL